MQDVAEYYLGRFKAVVSSTNKIALIFLFTIFYVWYKSISPAFGFLENIVTSKEQSIYFDSVYSPLKRSFSNDLSQLYKQKRKDFKQQINSFTRKERLIPYQSSGKDTFLVSNSYFTAALSTRRNNYNAKVLPMKHIRDSITDKLQDSLKRYQLKIDIPTLNTIEVDFNIGIPIWMSLTSLFLVLMFYNRNTSFGYLQRCLRVYFEKKADFANLDHLDVNIPFWMHPFTLGKELLNGKKVGDFLQDYQSLIKRTLVIFVLILLLFMQYRAACLIWNKHSFWAQYQHTLFESAYISRAIAFIMLSVSTVIAVLWLIPGKVNIDRDPEQVLNSSRRKFLTAGAVVFCIQFMKPSYLFSDIKPQAFNYRRKKPLNGTKKVLVPTFSGFYLNSRKRYQTLHYFDENGKNIMLKTIAKKDRQGFLSNLKKVNIFDYFEKIKAGTVKFPGSVWALEIASKQHIKDGKFSEAMMILKNGIEINLYSESRLRLTAMFKKELEYLKNQLSSQEKHDFRIFLSSTQKKVKKVNKYIRTAAKV